MRYCQHYDDKCTERKREKDKDRERERERERDGSVYRRYCKLYTLLIFGDVSVLDVRIHEM